MRIPTKTCIVCGKTGSLDISESGWRLWQQGAYTDDAFPELTAGEREQFISGTHEECFDSMFPYEE